MSVRTDASGRRWVAVEVEVPGTPEEVWQAIATGPGVSSWFVPTEIEERDGVPVSVTSHFGPGMDAVAKVTAWDPPRRFAAEGEWGPGAPPVATEWIVEGMAETESPRETRDIVWNLWSEQLKQVAWLATAGAGAALVLLERGLLEAGDPASPETV